jgi:hypothetical protein
VLLHAFLATCKGLLKSEGWVHPIRRLHEQPVSHQTRQVVIKRLPRRQGKSDREVVVLKVGEEKSFSIGRPRVAGMFQLMSAVLSLLRLPVPS